VARKRVHDRGPRSLAYLELPDDGALMQTLRESLRRLLGAHDAAATTTPRFAS
jgi:hypothetical protein